ncbi:MAG: ABC transporter ATP-binding protein [Bacteroidota bacterium]
MHEIVFDRLSKTYVTGEEEVHALRGISLTIALGEFVAVVGPSGSGKSTLLSILGGLRHPSEGTLLVEDIDVYSLSVERRADFRREFIGFVFQSFQLVPHLTVIENVILPLAVAEVAKKAQKEKARATLESVGLLRKQDRLPNALSGGEQQRAAIARALVNDPPIVLADEPTGNLDTTTSHEIMQLLHRINREGRTIVMVTHNPENLKYVGRCIRMRDGELHSGVDPVVNVPWEHRAVS